MTGSSRASFRQLKRSATMTIMAAVVLVQAIAGPHAHAAYQCQDLFTSLTPDQIRFREILPIDLLAGFHLLKPRVATRFERRFEKRDKIRAENEAMRLVAELLLDHKATSLALLPLLKKETRSQSISQVLTARLKNEGARVELEKILIEAGYSEGTAASQKWRAFREKHFRQLESIKRFAINTATTSVIGVPMYLRGFQYQQFRTSQAARADWAKTENEIRKKIDARDPQIVRDIKIEIALEMVRRIIAVAILAILADEFLEFMTPKWHLIKGKIVGSIFVEERSALEKAAFENWKDVAEAFTGQRPSDTSPEAIEILERIKSASRDDLYLHVHEGGPLAAPTGSVNFGDQTPSAEELQMIPMPIFGL